MSANPAASRVFSVQKTLGFLTETEPVPEHIERLHGPALTSPEQTQTLLSRFGRLIQTDKPAVAASQFAKWYCRALVAVLYEFSAAGVSRSASLRDVSVLFPGGPPIAVQCGGRTVSVTEASREWLRELTVIRLFAHNWNLVFKSLRELTGIREDVLWENGSVYLHYFYREWIENAPDAKTRERLVEDYRYIHVEAPPELFGELQCFNPFQWTGKKIRSTCCLRYQLPEGKYCKGCPIPQKQLRS